MLDHPPTPLATLDRARRIAMRNGIRYAYTGNVHDPEGSSTWCHQCGTLLIGRRGYEVNTWHLTREGTCYSCGTPCPGVFQGPPGHWGSRRKPVRMNTWQAGGTIATAR
jgi:pyruvate formate lyase activating enzyme